jgi:glutathionylspermidine synthase
MQRIAITPRPGWQKKVERLGLLWHTADGQPYWNESAYYRFNAGQIDEIEAATAELYKLCLQAGQHIIDDRLLPQFGIPDHAVPLIERAWEEEPPALNHGRFDLGYDGRNPPKMFEYNCDTPTALFEAAVVQWSWKEEVFPADDQFTSLHDKLIAKWHDIGPYLRSKLVHFTHVDDPAAEDTLTVTYLRDLAEQAGLRSQPIFIHDVGWDARRRRLVDLDDRPIDVLFHLYPWEWLLQEKFGCHVGDCYDQMQWIEPVWKMLWSNKALLAVLWQLFPDHPNLLPAHIEPGPAASAGNGRWTGEGASYVRKPFLGREGCNLTVVKDGRTVVETGGNYGREGYVYQQLYELLDFNGIRPVIGSWIVDGEPAGMGIREGGVVTGNTGQFVPHVFSRR